MIFKWFKWVLTLWSAIFYLSYSASAEDKNAQFGVVWSIPNDPITARKELILFQKIGFTDLLVKQLPSTEYLDLIEQFDFGVSISLPNQFLTTTSIQDEFPRLIDQIYDYSYYLNNYKKIKKLGIFDNGQIYSKSFAKALDSLIHQVNPKPFDFFFTHPFTRENQCFSSIEWYVYFDKYDLTRTKLTPCADSSVASFIIDIHSFHDWSNRVLQSSVSLAKGKPIYIPSNIVLNPAFDSLYANQITDFIKYPGHLITMKSEPILEEHPDYLVMIFWLCVIVFGFHFSIDPNFRKSISRYFFAHSFFAGDIMENRVRFSTSTIIASLTQAVLSGMLSILLFSYILNSKSVEAVQWYYPYLSHWTSSLILLFLFGFTHHLAIILIQVVWLYFSFEEFKSIFQPATLIIWPQVINFFLSIVIVNSYFNSINGYFIGAMIGLYIAVIFGTYFLACRDIFNGGRKVTRMDHLKTTIPYSIGLIVSVMFYLWGNGFFDVVNLSYHLSLK